MTVPGFKLYAGHQQGGQGAQLGLDPGAGVWVQRNLLYSRWDLLDGTADVLQGTGGLESGFKTWTRYLTLQKHTFLFLWQTLTSRTSRDTEFCWFSLS